MDQHSRVVRYQVPLALAALVCLVVLVFAPVLDSQFVYLDVRRQVIDNPHIQGLSVDNLKHIFSSRCVTSYYPVRTLSYAIDHQLWGLNPRGFKLTNGAVHLANVFLVFWLILRLCDHPPGDRGLSRSAWDVSAAAFSAGIFAVHPAVVEPVVWVAGREELLMTFGALGCIHCHLTARRRSEGGAGALSTAAWHAAAACFSLAASLANAVAAVIPFLITAWDLLSLPRPKAARILSGTFALWLISLATVAIKLLGPSNVLPDPGLPGPLSAKRLMLVFNTYRLNLKTLFWPTDLAFSYDWRLSESILDPGVIVGGIAVAATGALLWSVRRQKMPLFGLIWFGLALGPTAQVIPHHVSRADRFLYLPLVGLALLSAAGVKSVAQTARQRASAIIAGLVVLSTLGVLAVRQVHTWRDAIHVWEHCLEVDPDNYFARYCLADNLAHAGQFERAFAEYRRALEVQPDCVEALSNFAWTLATWPDRNLRDCDEATRLAGRACELTGWKDPKHLRRLSIAYTSFATFLAGDGLFEPAVEKFNSAILADPGYDLPRFNLALLLAKCPDAALRDPDKAVRLAEQALGLIERPDARQFGILAEVYAAAGRPSEAVGAAEQSIRLAEASGDDESARKMKNWLESFRQPPPPKAVPH